MFTRWITLVITQGAVLSALAAPRITAPSAPQTNSVSLGANLTLKVMASTASPPLAYSWRLDDVELGVIGNSLILTNIQAKSAGTYSIRVSDLDGFTDSNPFIVDVDSTFTKVTASPVVSSGQSAGVAWGDFNNDGYLDLFVAGNPINLFSNRTDGTFAKVPADVIPAVNSNQSAVWGDYDNDGYLDLYLSNGSSMLFHNLGGAKFVQVTTNGLGKAGNYGFGSWADYDRDGNLDLFVSSGFTKAVNTLFHNLGGGVFAKDTNSIVSHDVPQYSEGVSWGDYDNDGYPDLFIANGRDYNNGGAPQKSFLYHNRRDGTFEKITNSVVATTLGGFAAGIWGDYDNDGFLDLFVCGYANGNLPQKRYLFRNHGDGTSGVVTNAGPMVTESGYDQGCAWVDYDNDGHLDLFITSGGPNAFKDTLYHNESDGTFTKVLRGSLVNDGGEGAGCAWGDFNNDGFQDLYVSNFQNQTPEKNAFYINNGNANAWLTVRCQARVSNRSAIGAKVRVKATIRGRETWQMREIAANGGYLSQTSLEACFGLGDAIDVDEVRIEWPSGEMQTFRHLSPRQFFTVTEPSRLIAGVLSEGGAIPLTVIGGKGLVYDLERSTDLVDWEYLGSVTNLTGKVIYNVETTTEALTQFFRSRER